VAAKKTGGFIVAGIDAAGLFTTYTGQDVMRKVISGTESRMTRSERALSMFRNGYNCAQSVLFSFSEELGIDGDTALRIASGFGGGMGRMQEVCGAVTGGIMVIGLRFGRGEQGDRDAAAEAYAKTRALMEQFALRHGSYCCRNLLGGCELQSAEGRKAFVERDLINRICAPCVSNVVEILEPLIAGDS
jgi:C_GCAxxG_C_C family probable redox protein